MNTEEISITANDSAVEMTLLNMKIKKLKGHKLMKQEQIDNNTAVKKMLEERGINVPSRQDLSQN
jgi:hypothetical protein